MLRRPFLLGAGAVIISSDNLVEEAFTPKNAIQQNFTVMDLTIVDVKIQAAVRFEHAVGLDQARLEEGQIIIEQIGIRFLPDADGFITPALEAGPVTVFAALGLDLRAGLDAPGVEGRVDVNEIDTPIGE